MYRKHKVRYYFPREFASGWRDWVGSKQVWYHGGRVTVLGFTIEWRDYHFA